MASLDELRNLAAHLPPNFQVKPSEVAQVLSGLVQLAEHGNPIVEAGNLGAQAVADFYHQEQVKHAEAIGAAPPQKGAPVYTEPVQYVGAAPGQQVTPQQIAELLQAIQGLAARVANAERGTNVQVGPSSPEPPVTPAPAETPAPVQAGIGYADTPAPAAVPDVSSLTPEQRAELIAELTGGQAEN